MLWCLSLYHDLSELIVVVELHLKCLFSTRTTQYAGLGLIAHHGEDDLHGVGGVQVHVKLTMEIGHDELPLRQYRDTGKLYGMTVLIGHPAL